MLGTRLIPKDTETQPTIFDLAQTNKWTYLKRVKADPENMIPGESIFRPQDINVTVHYVNDFISEVTYILLKAEDVDDLQDVADEIREGIPIFTSAEILALYPAAKSEAEKLKAIRLTGIAAPGASDPKFLEIFRAAMSASEAAVRLSAVTMTGYAGWPQLLELLKPLRDNDADDAVRDTAGNMVKAMDAAQNRKT